MSSIPATQGVGSLTRIYDQIEATLPGAQHPIVEMVLWDTIEEFCIDSTWLRRRVFWTMGKGINQIDLNPLSGSETVCWILDVQGLIHYEALPPSTLIDLSGDTNTPRQGYAMVAYKPIYLTESLPTSLTDQWHEGLKDGALMRLHAQPAKPYSNEKLAAYHGSRYRGAIKRARDAASRSNSGAPAQFTYPYFARGRRK